MNKIYRGKKRKVKKGDQRGKTRWVVFMKMPDGWEEK